MKLISLSIAVLLLVISFNLIFVSPEVITKFSNLENTNGFSMLPVYAANHEEDFPVLSAQGVIAVDINSGVILYEKSANSKLLPASTTKIMTALVALDEYKLDHVLIVNRAYPIGSNMNLAYGEKITFENLLYGLLIHSANDAAEVIADNYPGGREAFINAMNKKAIEFKLTNTHFENPTGFDSPDHYSSARDLVRLSTIAMQNPLFSKVVATKEWVAEDVNGNISHFLTNRNELLGKVNGVMGIKTGWTENARENLVTFVKRDEHPVLIALLGSQDRFGETTELIEWVYKNFNWEEVQFTPGEYQRLELSQHTH